MTEPSKIVKYFIQKNSVININCDPLLLENIVDEQLGSIYFRPSRLILMELFNTAGNRINYDYLILYSGEDLFSKFVIVSLKFMTFYTATGYTDDFSNGYIRRIYTNDICFALGPVKHYKL